MLRLCLAPHKMVTPTPCAPTSVLNVVESRGNGSK